MPDLGGGLSVTIGVPDFGVTHVTPPGVSGITVLPVVGPQGPPGASGISGTAGIEVPVTTPASTWLIPVTGFNRRPNVAIYVGGEEVETDIVATSTLVTVTFPAPTAGTAVLT